MRTVHGLVVLLLCLALPAQAANYPVNQVGSEADASTADGFCDRNPAAGDQHECTLRAAIQQANAVSGPHNITILSSISTITLTAALDMVKAPVNFNGTTTNAASGGRLELNGNDLACFDLVETATAANANGARGSTIQNFVIRNCGGDGINLSGHGYTISGNRIGTNAAGSASDPVADANTGDGISLSGTATPPAMLPDIQNLIDNLPADFASIATYSADLQTALTVIANPTTITGNLISGNNGDGINMFTPKTVNTFVVGNIVGTDQASLIALPNGRGGGNFAGIRLSGGGYGNFIGPGNIVSGNNEDATDDGIVIDGSVVLPNFVMGNLVGPGATPLTDVGNGDVGIVIDTKPDTDNPTGFSLFLGPANTISGNHSDNGGADLDVVGSDTSAGLLITGTSSKVRVFGNFIGLFQFPAGGSPIGSLDTGNRGNGIVVTTSDNQIGGSQVFEGNYILRNARHGILIRGNATDNVTVAGNFIGVSPPSGLAVFDFGNGGDGVYISGASSNRIGGSGPLDDNVIAGNGRNGISVRNGSPGNGWANLIQRNQIFGNDRNAVDGFTGIGIDLERVVNGPDPIPDPLNPDPNTNYSNYGQNQPSICAGAPGEPLACLGASPPSFNGSATSVQWTVDGARPNSSLRVEFFATSPTSQVFLDEQLVTTDALGVVTGAGCVAGRCTSSVGGSTNTQAQVLLLTATDLFPADVPPIGLGPVDAPSNNTSEFSAPVSVPQPGELQFSLAAYSVGEAGGSATITVQRVNGADGAVSVDYQSSDGSAIQPNDYASSAGTLNWADQDSADKTFTVSIVNDSLDEIDEQLNLTLSNPGGNATLGSPVAATLDILDDDLPPSLAIADLSQAEGNGGSSTFDFVVSLSAASGQTVTVNYATADGSGTAPADYAAAGGSLSFLPGEISKNVSVTVVADAVPEFDDSFVVNLSAPVNATISDNQGQGTIIDDDSGPVFTIGDVTLAEGNVGTTAFTFTVTRSATTGAASVQADTSDGSALAVSDYAAVTAQLLNFADGVATQTVTVLVNGDDTFEANEGFTVLLSNASVGTSIGDASGLGTISNDDGQPTISINDLSLAEGNAATTPFTFTASLSNPSDQAISVSAASADGSANAGSDYTALPLTVVNFPAGSISQPVTVNVSGDGTPEPDETFVVNLSAPVNATISDNQGQGTIIDDDSGPVFTISDVTLAEGNVGTTAFTFTVTRSATTGAVSVQADTSDGSALAVSDYTAVTAQVLNFADGVATQPVIVLVNGDIVFEANETFSVVLSNASVGTSIGDPSGLGTISNDDGQPTISINDLSLAEGNAATTAFTFTASLSNPSDQAISVSAASADGSATAGSDYAALAASMLSFVPGSVSQTVTVSVNGDITPEPNETFVVNLSAPVNASIADAQGQGTISNDDTASTSFSGPTVPGSGTFTGTFTGGGIACGFVSGSTQLLAAPPGILPVPPDLPVVGAVFPHGMFAMDIANCSPGATLNFTFNYPQALPPGTVFWKYGRNSSSPGIAIWYEMPATISGNQISFTITDGGLGDDDLSANGAIVDPSGPAFVPSGVVPTAVPLMGIHGRLALLGLLLLLGSLALRRRQFGVG